MWIALAVAVVLVGLTVAAVFGRIDGSLVEPTTSLSYLPLPDGPLTVEDIQALRLDTGLRGYRMDQVDDVLDRLSAEIAELREQAHTHAQPPAEQLPAEQQQSTGQDPAGMPPASPYERPAPQA